MAYQVSWLVPQRVILVVLEAKVSSEEFRKTNAEMTKLVEAGNAPIHILVDISKLTHPPTDIQMIASTTIIKDDKVAYVVAIGGNALVNFIAQMVKTLTKTKITMVAHMDEARQFLAEVDSTIPML